MDALPTRGHPSPRPIDVPSREEFAAAIAAGRPFVSRLALAEGLLTRYRLTTHCRPVFPGVYVAKHVGDLSARARLRAAWLWAPSGSALVGWAAAMAHGERWFASEAVVREIEVSTAARPRCPEGIRIRSRQVRIPDLDLVVRDGMTVTSPARTALDLARWLEETDLAICAVDSLCNATRTALVDVAGAAERVRGGHGVRRALERLAQCDPASDSPPETRLRLEMARSGLPRPTTQLRIANEFGAHIATADLGYAERRVAIFYDGSVHRRPGQWHFDARVTAELTELGWYVVRVTAEMSTPVVLRLIASGLARGLGAE